MSINIGNIPPTMISGAGVLVGCMFGSDPSDVQDLLSSPDESERAYGMSRLRVVQNSFNSAIGCAPSAPLDAQHWARLAAAVLVSAVDSVSPTVPKCIEGGKFDPSKAGEELARITHPLVLLALESQEIAFVSGVLELLLAWGVGGELDYAPNSFGLDFLVAHLARLSGKRLRYIAERWPVAWMALAAAVEGTEFVSSPVFALVGDPR